MKHTLPPEFPNLPALAQNLWWSWSPTARKMFAYFDATLWRLTHHDPMKQMQEIHPVRLEALRTDDVFCRRYADTANAFHAYMNQKDHWFGLTHPALAGKTIAYFSAEFGLDRSVPLYSGGLGILAGDHLKEASDLGVPIVGVGFMYSQAYFRQVISAEGWQHAVYESSAPHMMPIDLARTAQGDLVKVSVKIGEREVVCLVWQIHVGRVRLLLLDTDTPDNAEEDRPLSARLYGGDHHTRLCQELLLGIGGVRALRALGIQPDVWHANEGHPAFLLVERLAEHVRQGLSLEEACHAVRRTTVFTTHTPVPAGHDVFAPEAIDEHCSWWWKELGLSMQDFMQLGTHPEFSPEHFHMTALAIRLASFVNGVSQEHERVSKAMFHVLWPNQTLEEVPIHHVTNGVHVPTWIAEDMEALYAKYLGRDWCDRCDDAGMWRDIHGIPNVELWRTRQALKQKMLVFLRQRVRLGWTEGQLDAAQALARGVLLEPRALTIGFARRFATYKRAALLFANLDRLRTIVMNPWKPVQIIFAGKAHPADNPGRELIHHIYQFAKTHDLGGHVAFVEDYDMHVAKYLVQGVDVWLNNPRPPLEASGTSGQKAGLNGVPNLSVLDGWWSEGYAESNGWAITRALSTDDEREQDDLDADALYSVLEKDVIPLYYERDADDVPHGWCDVVKSAIETVAPQFSARRMLKDYVERAYAAILSRKS